jgi:ribonucleotide reductase beta subunit family protein with ferritin-like domain
MSSEIVKSLKVSLEKIKKIKAELEDIIECVELEFKPESIETRIELIMNSAVSSTLDFRNVLNQFSMSKRWNLMPIDNVELFKKYKELEASIWTSNELDYVMDRDGYIQLPETEKTLFKNIFRFFSVADGAVSENLAYRFILESKTYEEQVFFISQLANELVHSETYSLIIRTIFSDDKEYKNIVDAVDNIQCIKDKGVFIDKYILNAEVSPTIRYFAFVIVERLMFMTLFAGIFYFKKYGMLKNTILANKLIARDETLHAEAGAIQFKRMCAKYGKPDASVLRGMLDEAIKIENEFSKILIGEETIGELSKTSFENFAKSLANDIIVMTGYSETGIFYKDEKDNLVKNTISYVEGTMLDVKTNFFEGRGSEYNRFDPTKAVEKFLNPLVEKKSDIVADNSEIDF